MYDIYYMQEVRRMQNREETNKSWFQEKKEKNGRNQNTAKPNERQKRLAILADSLAMQSVSRQ